MNEDSEDEIDEINVNEKNFNNPSQTDNKLSEQTFKYENVISKQKENFTWITTKKKILTGVHFASQATNQKKNWNNISK